MQQSDFEIVTAHVVKKPGMTGREISVALRREGYERFSSKLVNQILYRLLSARMIERDGTGEKPKWYPVSNSSGRLTPNTTQPPLKRPLDDRETSRRNFVIATTEINVLLVDDLSPNDPYMVPDWVGTHIVASVNTKHPFWNTRLVSSSDRAIFSMIAAVDAYVQWKVAQLHEPPDATEVQKMRDYALRFCTLAESEQVRFD